MVFRFSELLQCFSRPKLSFCPCLSVRDICLRGQAFSVCMICASLCLPSQDLFFLFVVCLSVYLSTYVVVIGYPLHRSGVYYYARLAVNILEITCVISCLQALGMISHITCCAPVCPSPISVS